MLHPHFHSAFSSNNHPPLSIKGGVGIDEGLCWDWDEMQTVSPICRWILMVGASINEELHWDWNWDNMHHVSFSRWMILQELVLTLRPG